VNESPVPYQVSYSERVLQQLKALGYEAAERGDGTQFVEALKEFHRLLTLYPQFGEPYLDLSAESGRIYKGFVRPLAMRYAVYEDRRLVMVVAPPVLLPKLNEEMETE
jgi:hypothetical protein